MSKKHLKLINLQNVRIHYSPGNDISDTCGYFSIARLLLAHDPHFQHSVTFSWPLTHSFIPFPIYGPLHIFPKLQHPPCALHDSHSTLHTLPAHPNSCSNPCISFSALMAPIMHLHVSSLTCDSPHALFPMHTVPCAVSDLHDTFIYPGNHHAPYLTHATTNLTLPTLLDQPYAPLLTHTAHPCSFIDHLSISCAHPCTLPNPYSTFMHILHGPPITPFSIRQQPLTCLLALDLLLPAGFPADFLFASFPKAIHGKISRSREMGKPAGILGRKRKKNILK